jgi:hypothetical protein
VIQYFSPKPDVPPWMVGAPNLNHREVRGGFCWGVGSTWMLEAPRENAVDLTGGYKCWMNDDGPEPEYLYKSSQWIRTFVVSDSRDRTWSIPIILNSKGKRDFKVAYDFDWKPALSHTQQLLMNWAEEATIFLQEYQKSGECPEPAPGCAWAAKFVSEVNYINPEVIGKLHLMDDLLMVSTLMGATSRRPSVEEVDHG